VRPCHHASDRQDRSHACDRAQSTNGGIGHSCRIESLNQPRKAGRLKQVSGPQRCRPHAIPACDPHAIANNRLCCDQSRGSVRRASGLLETPLRSATFRIADQHGSDAHSKLADDRPFEDAEPSGINSRMWGVPKPS
jgi:hypothetical protein